MKLRIRHLTRYDYTQPVFIEPHTLKLIPQTAQHLSLVGSKFAITPTPAGKSFNLESNGSLSQVIWFEGMISSLAVESIVTVNTTIFNPFDFLVYPVEAGKLGYLYPKKLLSELQPFLTKISESSDMKIVINDLKIEEQEAVIFLTDLMRKINSTYDYELREFGNYNDPKLTIAHKRGSCRDLAVLFLAVCRDKGLASRFVSGYFFNDDSSESELHAWVEVYIPGAGWRGFDPTLGILCAENHIALTSSCDPSLTLPVSGTYRGDAKANLTVELEIEKV